MRPRTWKRSDVKYNQDNGKADKFGYRKVKTTNQLSLLWVQLMTSLQRRDVRLFDIPPPNTRFFFFMNSAQTNSRLSKLLASNLEKHTAATRFAHHNSLC